MIIFSSAVHCAACFLPPSSNPYAVGSDLSGVTPSPTPPTRAPKSLHLRGAPLATVPFHRTAYATIDVERTTAHDRAQFRTCQSAQVRPRPTNSWPSSTFKIQQDSEVVALGEKAASERHRPTVFISVEFAYAGEVRRDCGCGA